MRIQIINDSYYIGENIKPGEYEILSYDTPTEKQNRLWHALLQCFWASGCHSYNAKSFNHFRALMKLYLGAGMEKFCNVVDVDGKPFPQGRTDYRLKSWADYSKKERQETIDRLIAEMHQSQVQTKQFYEILSGLESNDQEIEYRFEVVKNKRLASLRRDMGE